MWFRETVLGLWDTGKRGTGVRGKSLAVLGELARFLTKVEDEDAEAQRWREQVKDDISSDFLVRDFASSFTSELTLMQRPPTGRPDRASTSRWHHDRRAPADVHARSRGADGRHARSWTHWQD